MNSTASSVMDFVLLPIRIVLVLKANLPILKAQKTPIRDRYAMGVAGEVLEHLRRAAERPFGVNDPVMPDCGIDQLIEPCRFGIALQLSIKAQLPLPEGPLQKVDELATEYATEHA